MLQRLSTKQPAESWLVDFDFSPALDSPGNPDAGENIDDITEVVITDADTNEDMTAAMAAPDKNRVIGQNAYIWVTGGASGSLYKITCRIRAALSDRILEIDALMPVREF